MMWYFVWAVLYKTLHALHSLHCRVVGIHLMASAHICDVVWQKNLHDFNSCNTKQKVNCTFVWRLDCREASFITFFSSRLAFLWKDYCVCNLLEAHVRRKWVLNKMTFCDLCPFMCEADIKFVVRLRALCGLLWAKDGLHGVVVGMMNRGRVGCLLEPSKWFLETHGFHRGSLIWQQEPDSTWQIWHVHL